MIWFLIVVALVLAVASLRGDGERERYVRERLRVPAGRDWPRALVIVPVKGGDEGLELNLRALAGLDYPAYELIVVARAQADVPPIAMPTKARLMLAGEGDAGTGEKINNLLAAVRAAPPDCEVLAFADSDGRVSPGWLKALVAGLDEPEAGAATGYRWHVPEPVDAASILRSVWNAVIAGGFGPGGNRFVWGGAMAIRREVFDRARVAEYWKDAISDDYRLSQAVRDAGLRIVYAPGATVAACDHTSLKELFGWIRRQMMITRFYAPGLWRVALVAHLIYCGAMVAALMAGGAVALSCLALQLTVGMWKGARRARLARLSLPGYEHWFRRYGWLHTVLVPVGTWLWLYSCIAAAVSDTIEWRGYRYRLRRLPGLRPRLPRVY